jgi:hypothetical protein
MKITIQLFVACIAVLFASFFISSCKAKDKEAPTISVFAPSENDTFKVTNDSVHIEFSARDNMELHIVEVNIKNSAGTLLYNNNRDVDNKNYAFHEHFNPSGITSLTPVFLTIKASDHSDNEFTKTVNFFVAP